MDDPRRMSRLQRGTDFLHHPQRIALRQRSLFQPRAKIASLHVLHGEKQMPRRALAELIDIQSIPMLQAPQRLCLPAKPLGKRLTRAQLRRRADGRGPLM